MKSKDFSFDDYRHKLVNKILKAESYEQIKRYLITAMRSLKKHEMSEDLIIRFIDKSINQLHGLVLLEIDIRARLNIKYAKSQLKIIKRHAEKEKVNYV